MAQKCHKCLVCHSDEKAEAINLPTLFLGDFNMDVSQLDLYPELVSRGYMSLQELHRKMYQCDMPVTCKNATTPDTALVHPCLIPRLKAMAVDKQAFFDAHDPVILAFEVPQAQIFNIRLSKPKTWTDIPLDAQDISDAAAQTCNQVYPETLEDWALLVENTVDFAIKTEFQKNPELATFKSLAKHYRGRCQPPKFRKIQQVTPFKKGWQGDFMPEVESGSFKSRQIVKQIRRLSSLRHRLRKASQAIVVPESLNLDLWQEWAAIMNAKIVSCNFLQWAENVVELMPLPTGMPTQSWILDAENLLQHQLRDMLHFEQSLRLKKSKMQHIIDNQDNFKKAAYKSLRNQNFQAFHHVQKEVTRDAIVVQHDSCTYECFVDNAPEFQPMSPLRIDDITAKLVKVEQYSLLIKVPEGHPPLPEQVQLQQQCCTFRPCEVFHELTDYWSQFWNRQIPDDQVEYLDAFSQPLPQIPLLDDDFEANLEDWKIALNSCKNSSSPGTDGFSFQELKMLPDVLLQHLVRIISSLDEFPDHLMIARTVPIPKKGMLSAQNSRPITVLATLYRLWGKVCARRCLHHLSRHVTKSVTGLLPHRGAHDSSYSLQTQLEIQRFQRKHVVGLTLDLRKCFNLLCREKIAKLLLHYGIPPRLVSKWATSLGHLCRFWEITNNCSDIIKSNAGCPEGDTWSVMAMVVASDAWALTIRNQYHFADAVSYADNWSISMPEHDLQIEPVSLTCKFVSWLCLQINWEKTWTWSTSTTGAPKLSKLLLEVEPDTPVQTMLTATDLGCQMTYHGDAKLGILHERFQSAKKRLEVIKHSS